jgi:hypothetical protein
MENQVIQSSFIPKQSLTKKPERRQAPMGLINLICFVVFAVSLAVFLGALAYRYTLAQEINRPCPDPMQTETRGCGLIASLEKERQLLNHELLTRLRRVDAKSTIAKGVIDRHITLIPLFDLLNRNTLTTIQYKKFTFGEAGVTVEGLAASYEDIALQSKELAKLKEIRSFIFSGLNLDAQGNVTFKLDMTIDENMLSFRKFVEQNPLVEQVIIIEEEVEDEDEDDQPEPVTN